MSRVLFLLAIASFRDAAVAATRARVEGPSAADLAVAKGARIIGGTRVSFGSAVMSRARPSMQETRCQKREAQRIRSEEGREG